MVMTVCFSIANTLLTISRQVYAAREALDWLKLSILPWSLREPNVPPLKKSESKAN